MFCEKVDNVLYDFKISGKYACIKRIRFYSDADQTKTIVIPSEVHYENYTYIVNAIYGYTTQEAQYKTVVTDRRRKDYGKQEYVGERTIVHGAIDLRVDYDNWVEIILPDTIREIGPFAVYHKNYITIKLNEGLKIIHSDAFTSYNGKRIKIPHSVKTIKDGAFINCERLTLIVDNEPGSIKIGEKAIADRSYYREEIEPRNDFEIAYLRPKTSWISKLVNKLKNI